MKRSIICIAMFIIMSFTAYAQQTQTGTFVFNDKLKDYSLNNGEGDRVVQIEVDFPKPFDTKPDIFLTVGFVDSDVNFNLRYEVTSFAVSRDGFIIKARTWSDSKIYTIGGTWYAHAEKLEIKKEQIVVGKTFELKNIYFETNKADLLPSSFPELDIVVQFMAENPKVEIEISGHTDNVGTQDYNMSLSEKRAESCKNYIISKKINVARITSKGYGMSKPVASNNDEAGREKNRRVEFTITKK